MDETQLRALVEALSEAVQTARNYYMLFHDSEWKDRLDRWDAALQAASPVPRVEWQPIETAPVGTQVWAWDDERGSNPAMLVDGEWHITYDDAIIHPKYWQPLPDPLARKTERGAPSGV
jgi:hypothetical protein